MTDYERARKYLAKCPPAVSGDGGHVQTFSVAVALVNGFGLDEHNAFQLLTEYNATCSPAWSERELRHKIKSAMTATHDKPRGHLLGSGRVIRHSYGSTPATQIIAPTSKPQVVKGYDLTTGDKVPDPLPDGSRAFLKAMFRDGEGISISPEVQVEGEAKTRPKDGGIVLSREEWLSKLDARDGDPNKIFTSSAKLGAYIRLNPIKLGGSRDADVTSFRHALLEFDKIASLDEQWRLIKSSNVPCTAVTYSGKKSLHACVFVDAKDLKEYQERVDLLYAHFEAYIERDEKGKVVDRVKANRNPSRFSRLPGMVRGDSKQTLLALGIGAASFADWTIEKSVDDLGEEITIDMMEGFVPATDPNTLLGDRYLCRGGSCVIVGQSGIGKSSLNMQAAMLWALGRPVFGIAPSRPLKSLIVQAENDMGDMAEMYQGVKFGVCGGDPDLSSQYADEFKKLLSIHTISDRSGDAFLVALRRLVDKYKPDLVWLDNLNSFIGGELGKAEVAAKFLRAGLNSISKATGVAWMIIHHTGKPPADKKGQKNWTSSDFSYIGLGSSEITNWARAVMVLRELESGVYGLMLAKRGPRAKAKDFQLQHACNLFLEHSKQGINWLQIDEPKEEIKHTVKGKSAGRATSKFDYDAFLTDIKGEYFSTTKLAERAAKFSGLSERTIFAKVMDLLKAKMDYDEENECFSVMKTDGPF